MKLELREVDRHNLEAVCKLSVAEGQNGFVAPNVVSMAEAKVYPECFPMAIYADGMPVGFLMYALNGPDDEDSDDENWLVRLMIDAAFQGKGYGRQAMQLLLERLQQISPQKRELFLSVEPENEHAISFYRSLGFAFDGRVLEGERVMRLGW